MRVVVVRHACAGDKGRWPSVDADRPLDRVGVVQAEALAQALAEAGIGRILTSPTRRCHDTVAPLARRLGLAVEGAERLAVADDELALAKAVAEPWAADAVLCTHGELMRPVLAAARRPGVRIDAGRLDDDWLLHKGTAWDLTVGPSGCVVALAHVTPVPLLTCEAHEAA